MPKLKCNVTNCMFNYSDLCTKHSISVDGPSSFSKSETSCCSFEAKPSSDYIYEFGDLDEDVKPETTVHCDAIRCVFQRNSMCHADKIEIKVPTSRIGSKSYHDTMCKTFECIDE